MRTPEQTLAELDAIAARAEAAPRIHVKRIEDVPGSGQQSVWALVERFVATAPDDLRDLVALVRGLVAERDELRERMARHEIQDAEDACERFMARLSAPRSSLE